MTVEALTEPRDIDTCHGQFHVLQETDRTTGRAGMDIAVGPSGPGDGAQPAGTWWFGQGRRPRPVSSRSSGHG
jgi:hypothetical protein